MEKYYLSKVEDVDYNKRIKLVEITYSRKAPSFGLLYVSSRTHRVHLKALELTENNDVQFLQLKKTQDCPVIVDFDTCDSISLEEDKQTLQCVLLTTGNLPLNKCQLNKDGALVALEVADKLRDTRFFKCRLTSQDSLSFVHLLAQKSYTLLRSTGDNSLEQINSYSLLDSRSSGHLSMMNLHLLPQNPKYILLEISDHSMRIINGKRGYLIVNLDLEKELSYSVRHFVFPGDTSTSILLLSQTQASLSAHSIVLNQDTSQLEDPDNLLLPTRDSLEVEKCWTIDLDAVESLQQTIEEDVDLRIYLSPLWSFRQISVIHGKPKYLVVGICSNLLVYSFESLSSSSLPLAYDRFFMKDTEVETGVQVVDQKVKPSLIHNFKLIGSQSTDVLWNNIFLASGRRSHFIAMHHFQQMGLLVALTSEGHLLSFRLDTDEVPAQKDNLYQQQVSSSIRGSSSLLLSTIEALQSSNKSLKQDISMESKRLLHEDGTQTELKNLLKASLNKASDIGAMYSLDLSISDLIQVSEIVITSSVNSSFMKPSGATAAFLESITIDNNYSMRNRGILWAQANPEASLFQPQEVEDIMACVRINIKSHLRNVMLSLPMFMTDGRRGRVRVYFVLADKEFEGSSRYLSQSLEDSSHSVALQLSINLKTLHSYQRSQESHSSSEATRELKITGSFSAVKMVDWLRSCLQLPAELIGSPTDTLELCLFSNFTYGSIRMRLRDNQLELSSDDMFARETIRKEILEQATGASVQLKIHGFQGYDEQGLDHLLAMQERNLEMIARISQQGAAGRCSAAGSERRDLLLELVRTELELSHQFWAEDSPAPPAEEETLAAVRDDLEEAIRLEGDKWCAGQETAGGADTFRGLVCGYILDCLADLEKFRGARVEEARLVAMQARLLELLNPESRPQEATASNFVGRVHLAWRETGALGQQQQQQQQ